MASDAVFSNNLPAGVWDDLGDNMPFNEFQDLDDYPQYIPACKQYFLLKMQHFIS